MCRFAADLACAVKAEQLALRVHRLDDSVRHDREDSRIEPQAGGRHLLIWDGVVEAMSMPPLLGEMLMRANIEDQFRGMVREIERRDVSRRERERQAKQ